MTESPFTHLHVHSEYSLSDGAIRISDLISKVKQMGHSAVAVTDHGNLFGAVEFYQKAKDADIKAIIGVEIYLQPTPSVWADLDDSERSELPGEFHMVLLAKDKEGYHNLARIVSSSYANGAIGSVPIVPFEALQKNSSNMIALSSCQLGEFGFLVNQLKDHTELDATELSPLARQSQPFLRLEKFSSEMERLFGKDNFYIELIDNRLPEQTKMLNLMALAAKSLSLPLVASADAHYLNEDDRDAHAVLVGVRNDLTMSKMRDRRKNVRFHVLDNEEMTAAYAAWPEALANSNKIAEQCNVEFTFGTYFLPTFDLGGESAEDGLTRLSKEGLEARLVVIRAAAGPEWTEEREAVYWKRLEYETGVIISMGFPGYFLIVQDFINWAKENDIPVGPGRGSGAGSIVAYALNITDLDPLPFNLIFERFLNPERVSMPDFDVDFCQDRREEVIQYVTRKYGKDNVAQITTFGKMLAKAAIRDVGRVLEVSYTKVDRIAKLIPNEIGIKLDQAIEQEPRIMEEAKRDPMIKDLLGLARKLEGLSRHTSVHAAGVVIAEGGMENLVPVYRDEAGTLITQYEMKNAEKVGLVKFDFLGLKTLTVIHKAVTLIRAVKDPEFDITKISLRDKKVFDLVQTSRSTGIFQLESNGMKQLLTKLLPSQFEDMIALVALFRPGPLGSGMVDDFIERKHGRQKIEYTHPDLEPILKETYGTILYQEQVQKIAAVLANYSLGEADLLRRAMGKKKPEEMEKQKHRFIDGCQQNKIDPKVSEDLFNSMAKFAEYGFNKSHSAAYGLVSYQTAFLKTHYPDEFFAAIMTCDLDNTDKIIRYIEDAREFGFKILPPDINRSLLEFDVVSKKVIGFGLAAIKGLGANSIIPILEERDQNGVFTSLSDLAKRVNLQKIGKKNIEMLVNSGAFDSFNDSRLTLKRSIPTLVRMSEDQHAANSTGQGMLFDMDDSDGDSNISFNIHDFAKEMPKTFKANDQLRIEKNLLGTYVSSHPVRLFDHDRKTFSKTTVSALPSMVDRGSVLIIGVLSDRFERTLKDGRRMMILSIEDDTGKIQPAMFDFDEEELPEIGTAVAAFFKVKKAWDGNIKPRLESIHDLEEYRRSKISGVELTLNSRDANNPDWQKDLETLRQILADFPGNTPVRFDLALPKGRIKIADAGIKVKFDDDLIQALEYVKPVCSGFDYQLGPTRQESQQEF